VGLTSCGSGGRAKILLRAFGRASLRQGEDEHSATH
jgi:hypothetical protein